MKLKASMKANNNFLHARLIVLVARKRHIYKSKHMLHYKKTLGKNMMWKVAQSE